MRAAAFDSTNSSLRKFDRKNGSAARRYICVKSVITTAILVMAP